MMSIALSRARHSEGATSDRKSTRLNSSHSQISYAVFCLKKKSAFLIGPRNKLGEHIPVGQAAEHMVVVAPINHWRARAVQNLEYQPLRPCLRQSFPTSMT